ncbi:MAG: Gldg family protein, partial [Endomicrobiia bacterium]
SLDEVSALVIVSPKTKFEEKEIKNIEEFLQSGKPVAFLIDKFNVNMQSFYTTKIETGLEKLLENYGIKILPGFVLDWQCQKVSIRTVQGFFTIQNIISYPLYPVATDISKTNPMVKDMESISFLYISPIEIQENQNFNYEVIVRSSKKSWYKENPYNLNPYNDYTPSKNDKTGKFNLCVIVSPKSSGGRIVVVGNSRFIQNEPAFFMNLIDYLMQDEDLIAIRSKGVSYRPLKQTSYGVRLTFKYISIFFVPILVIIYGIIRWNLRKVLKRNLKNIYA